MSIIVETCGFHMAWGPAALGRKDRKEIRVQLRQPITVEKCYCFPDTTYLGVLIVSLIMPRYLSRRFYSAVTSQPIAEENSGVGTP